MNKLDELYDLLSYVTENMVARKTLPKNFPPELFAKFNNVCNELGNYLDVNSPTKN